MAFDYQRFAGEIGMSDDDKASLSALFAKYPAAVTKLDSTISSEVTNRLSTAQAELETKARELDAQFETLASIRTGDETAIRTAEGKAEKLASELAVLRNRVERIGTENGIDVKAYLEGITEAVAPTTQAAKPAAMSEDDILKRAGALSRNAFVSAAVLEDIAQDHFDLTGKRLSREELIHTLQDEVRRTGNANLGLRDVWERKYNIPQARSERVEADVQRRIKEAETATETRVRDEMALRSVPNAEAPVFTGSPALALLTKDMKPRVVNGVSEAVRDAMKMFPVEKAAALQRAG